MRTVGCQAARLGDKRRSTRLTDRGANEYSASVARLTSTIEGAGPVLALAAAGKGKQAWPLGLVARALVDAPAGEARATARTLLGVLLGGWSFDERAARAWAAAAEDRAGDLLANDAPAGQAMLQAADHAVGSLQAEALVGVSDWLSAGLKVRLQDLASALARRASGAAEPGRSSRPPSGSDVTASKTTTCSRR